MDKHFIFVVFIILILKKIYELTTKFNKGNNLIISSFLRMTDEFGSFKQNSSIHSDNGAEFKSYEYKF